MMRNKLRSYTTDENNGLLLPSGMMTMDDEKKALRVYDGQTLGGFEIVGTKAFEPRGHGPQSLIGGDEQWGFYGEVKSNDFISADALATAIGFSSSGASLPDNNTTDWLKFNSNGKIVFVPKLPLRAVSSWEDIYQIGAVYGTGDVGPYPSGGDRIQDASLTLNGFNYKVRLLKGASSDPTINQSGYDVSHSHGSEWNRLLYRIIDDTTALESSHDTSSETGDKWAAYTEAELSLHRDNGNGSWSWCQETMETDTGRRVRRGYYGVSYFVNGIVTANNITNGWRPVLELVE